jgi:hypothetical protein
MFLKRYSEVLNKPASIFESLKIKGFIIIHSCSNKVVSVFRNKSFVPLVIFQFQIDNTNLARSS